MPFRKFQYEYKTSDGGNHLALTSSQFQQFKPLFACTETKHNQPNPEINHSFDALVATFDLEGFTPFCNQHDAYLVVHPFLKKFLEWTFSDLKTQLQKEEKVDGYTLLWARLPTWEKFTGDGMILLWDVSDFESTYLGNPEVGNIIVRLQRLCDNYQLQFLPKLPAHWKRVPKRLRCGVARGHVFPVGSGTDFVGGCMNLACRLQKVADYSFACAQKGLELDACFDKERRDLFSSVELEIRGNKEKESAFVLSSVC
jgi:class 3 adenylate cyclase